MAIDDWEEIPLGPPTPSKPKNPITDWEEISNPYNVMKRRGIPSPSAMTDDTPFVGPQEPNQESIWGAITKKIPGESLWGSASRSMLPDRSTVGEFQNNLRKLGLSDSTINAASYLPRFGDFVYSRLVQPLVSPAGVGITLADMFGGGAGHAAAMTAGAGFGAHGLTQAVPKAWNDPTMENIGDVGLNALMTVIPFLKAKAALSSGAEPTLGTPGAPSDILNLRNQTGQMRLPFEGGFTPPPKQMSLPGLDEEQFWRSVDPNKNIPLSDFMDRERAKATVEPTQMNLDLSRTQGGKFINRKWTPGPDVGQSFTGGQGNLFGNPPTEPPPFVGPTEPPNAPVTEPLPVVNEPTIPRDMSVLAPKPATGGKGPKGYVPEPTDIPVPMDKVNANPTLFMQDMKDHGYQLLEQIGDSYVFREISRLVKETKGEFDPENMWKNVKEMTRMIWENDDPGIAGGYLKQFIKQLDSIDPIKDPDNYEAIGSLRDEALDKWVELGKGKRGIPDRIRQFLEDEEGTFDPKKLREGLRRLFGREPTQPEIERAAFEEQGQQDRTPYMERGRVAPFDRGFIPEENQPEPVDPARLQQFNRGVQASVSSDIPRTEPQPQVISANRPRRIRPTDQPIPQPQGQQELPLVGGMEGTDRFGIPINRNLTPEELFRINHEMADPDIAALRERTRSERLTPEETQQYLPGVGEEINRRFQEMESNPEFQRNEQQQQQTIDPERIREWARRVFRRQQGYDLREGDILDNYVQNMRNIYSDEARLQRAMDREFAQPEPQLRSHEEVRQEWESQRLAEEESEARNRAIEPELLEETPQSSYGDEPPRDIIDVAPEDYESDTPGQRRLGIEDPQFRRSPEGQRAWPRQDYMVESRIRRADYVAESIRKAKELEKKGDTVGAKNFRNQAKAERGTWDPITKSEEHLANSRYEETQGNTRAAVNYRAMAQKAANEEAGQLKLRFNKQRAAIEGLTNEQALQMGNAVDAGNVSGLSHEFAKSTLSGLAENGPPGFTDYSSGNTLRYQYRNSKGKAVGYATGHIDPDAVRIGILAIDKDAGGLYGRAYLRFALEAAKHGKPILPSGSYSSHTFNALRRAIDLVKGEEGSFDPVGMAQGLKDLGSKIKDVTGWGRGVTSRAPGGLRTEMHGQTPSSVQYGIEAMKAVDALTLTGDVGAIGRQSMWNMMNPKSWMSAARGVRGAFDPSYAEMVDQRIRQLPAFKETWNPATHSFNKSVARDAGFKLFTDNDRIGPHAEGIAERIVTDLKFGDKSIPYVSNAWANTIGHLFKASNRFHKTFLNDYGANRFQELVDLHRDIAGEAIDTYDPTTGVGRAPMQGLLGGGKIPYTDIRVGLKRNYTPSEALNMDPYANKMLAKEIADFVSTVTGHPPLKTHLLPFKGAEVSLEPMAPYLSVPFLAPRLFAAKVRMLNPSTYMMATPLVRRQYMKALLGAAGAWFIGTQMLKNAIPGAQINNSQPTNSDYGKVRIGNVRLDMGGGNLQVLTALARMKAGGYTASTSGIYHEFGQGFQAQTRGSVLQNFAANKLRGLPKFVYDAFYASQNQPLMIKDRIAQQFIPMATGDLIQIYQTNPYLLPFAAPVVMMGGGTQIYEKGDAISKYVDPKNDWRFTGGSELNSPPPVRRGQLRPPVLRPPMRPPLRPPAPRS